MGVKDEGINIESWRRREKGIIMEGGGGSVALTRRPPQGHNEGGLTTSKRGVDRRLGDSDNEPFTCTNPECTYSILTSSPALRVPCILRSGASASHQHC